MKGLYLVRKCCLCSPIQFSSLSLPQSRFRCPSAQLRTSLVCLGENLSLEYVLGTGVGLTKWWHENCS